MLKKKNTFKIAPKSPRPRQSALFFGLGLVMAAGCGSTDLPNDENSNEGSGNNVGSVRLAVLAGPTSTPDPGTSDPGSADAGDADAGDSDTGDSGSPAPRGPVTMSDDDSTYTLSRSEIFLRHIELDLPNRMRCSDIDETRLAGGARCGSSSSSDSPDPLDDNEDKIVIDGPITIDLVTGHSSPDLSQVRVPTLNYGRIDFRFDNTWVSEATFDYGGQTMDLRMVLELNDDLRVEQPGGIALEDGEELMVWFNASRWLTGVSVSDCMDRGELSVSGTQVLVDAESDCGDDIEDRVEDNLKDSAQLHRR